MNEKIIKKILMDNVLEESEESIVNCSKILNSYISNKQIDNEAIKEEYIEEILYAFLGKKYTKAAEEIVNNVSYCGYNSILKDVNDIARFVIYISCKNGENIDVNKLNKVLFILQGYTLAKYNKLLFTEKIIKVEKVGIKIKKIYKTYNKMFDNPFKIKDLSFYNIKSSNMRKIKDSIPEDIVIKLENVLRGISKIDFFRLNKIFLNCSLVMDTEENMYIDYNKMKAFFETQEGQKFLNGNI